MLDATGWIGVVWVLAYLRVKWNTGMSLKNVLDRGHETSIRDFLGTQEEILWEGAPLPEKAYKSIESGWRHSSSPDSANISGLFLGIIILGAFYTFTEKKWITFLVFMLIGILVMILPDALLDWSKKNTRYVITNSRVAFQLWRYGQGSFHFVPFDQIVRVDYEVYENGSGNLYLIMKSSPDFWTYDFFNGNKRFHPSLENISDVMQVYNLLQSNLSKY
ncbi:MAG TPA: hypothetical protein VK168_14020 [Saprospiraceae bacterium]|nr:hypothetical protein [Saprospiraceae bacterium]